jgi:hypothetical protein
MPDEPRPFQVDDVQIDGCDRASDVSVFDLPLALKVEIDSIATLSSAEVEEQMFFERHWKRRLLAP